MTTYIAPRRPTSWVMAATRDASPLSLAVETGEATTTNYTIGDSPRSLGDASMKGTTS